MAILTEGRRAADYLVSEANDWRSRDEVVVTVPANTTLVPGTILGKLTASGKFVRHNAALTTGAEDESGILMFPAVNTTGSAIDVTRTITARDAEVNGDDLTYEDGADAGQITTSNAALAALGIIVR
ncbi:head decoration protein [Tropicimonas sp. IMCC34011]|uniref:head decoration protein n=1 Tax=Tropicimonas sp. IMCC34011 TaxID=2248759 RepID=UPI000E26FFED|nr:head decoration protein [Tropicimonas sp. IMCC34011]